MEKKLKKWLVFLLVILGSTFSMNAQEFEKKETGKVCFLRSTGIAGSLSPFKIYIDGELVCKLKNKKHSTHEVLVGKHECYVEFGGLKINEKTERAVIEVQPNKITYVQLFLENELLSFRIYGKEITKDVAEKKIKKMKEQVKCF